MKTDSRSAKRQQACLVEDGIVSIKTVLSALANGAPYLDGFDGTSFADPSHYCQGCLKGFESWHKFLGHTNWRTNGGLFYHARMKEYHERSAKVVLEAGVIGTIAAMDEPDLMRQITAMGMYPADYQWEECELLDES